MQLASIMNLQVINNYFSVHCTYIYIYIFLNVILRAIQERAESVSKKIGEKLTPEIRNSLKNAVSLEEVEELVGVQYNS